MNKKIQSIEEYLEAKKHELPWTSKPKEREAEKTFYEKNDYYNKVRKEKGLN